MIVVKNGLIAVEPLKSNSMQHQVRGGGTVKFGASRTELMPLKVVYLSCTEKQVMYEPGDTVYVRCEVAAHEWAQKPFEVEKEVRFILMPENFVVLHTVKEDTSFKDGSGI